MKVSWGFQWDISNIHIHILYVYIYIYVLFIKLSIYIYNYIYIRGTKISMSPLLGVLRSLLWSRKEVSDVARGGA